MGWRKEISGYSIFVPYYEEWTSNATVTVVLRWSSSNLRIRLISYPIALVKEIKITRSVTKSLEYISLHSALTERLGTIDQLPHYSQPTQPLKTCSTHAKRKQNLVKASVVMKGSRNIKSGSEPRSVRKNSFACRMQWTYAADTQLLLSFLRHACFCRDLGTPGSILSSAEIKILACPWRCVAVSRSCDLPGWIWDLSRHADLG